MIEIAVPVHRAAHADRWVSTCDLLDFSHGRRNPIIDELGAARIASGDVVVFRYFEHERGIGVHGVRRRLRFPHKELQVAECRNRDNQGSLSRAPVEGDDAECP